MNSYHIKKIFYITIIALVAVSFVLFDNLTFAQNEEGGNVSDEVLNLNDEINAKKDEVDDLKKQSEIYEKNIEIKRAEATSLENQLAILENQIAKTKIDIKATQVEIEKTELEVQATNTEIGIKEVEIVEKKEDLGRYIRSIHKSDQRSYLEVLVLNDSFSEFFDQLKYLEEIQDDLRKVLVNVKNLKEELEIKKADLENKKEELDNLQAELINKKAKLEDEVGAKEIIITETKESEAKFQSLLAQLKAEQQRIDSEIYSLEKKIRQKLEESDTNFQPGEGVILSWPIPFKGITTYFHDPDYPFRYIFEHPALDLRAAQGTPIRAAAPGYVARARDGGFGYSYIMVIHNDGISTVYGHVSQINVKEDQFVTRGQVIGLTGGMPGTRGAGRLTTGPHLHLEVRLDGIPVNPLDYLISL